MKQRNVQLTMLLSMLLLLAPLVGCDQVSDVVDGAAKEAEQIAASANEQMQETADQAAKEIEATTDQAFNDITEDVQAPGTDPNTDPSVSPADPAADPMADPMADPAPGNTQTAEQLITQFHANPRLVTDAHVVALVESLSKLPDGLTEFTELNLVATSVTGAGLSALKPCTSLQMLNLSGLSIANSDMEALLPLVNLESLQVDNTGISDAGVPIIAKLTSLRRLSLERCGITDAGIAQLKPLVNLEYLNLMHCQIEGWGFKEIRSLKLKEINAGHTQFGVAGFAFIKGSRSLEVLHVGSSSTDNSSLQGLVGCVNLRDLELGWNHTINDAGTQVLKALKQLERVDVNHTQVSNVTLGYMKNHKNLTIVEAGHTQINANGAAALKKLIPDVEVRIGQ